MCRLACATFCDHRTQETLFFETTGQFLIWMFFWSSYVTYLTTDQNFPNLPPQPLLWCVCTASKECNSNGYPSWSTTVTNLSTNNCQVLCVFWFFECVCTSIFIVNGHAIDGFHSYDLFYWYSSTRQRHYNSSIFHNLFAIDSIPTDSIRTTSMLEPVGTLGIALTGPSPPHRRAS